jgi:hypothetical protein
MSLNRKRVRAVVLKEFREYRRNSLIIGTMAVIPAVVIAIPLVVLLILPASAAGGLSHDHFLLYLLAVPAVVPTVVAAYSVVSERQQGTLEPLLSTPVGREEFLLGKALAALAPSLAVSFLVYGIFIGCVSLFAQPTVASAVIKGSDIVTIIIFAPLMASWPIWAGFSISAPGDRLPRRPATHHVRQLPAHCCGGAPCIQPDPCVARAGRTRRRSAADLWRARLAAHAGLVRQRAAHHEHQVARRRQGARQRADHPRRFVTPAGWQASYRRLAIRHRLPGPMWAAHSAARSRLSYERTQMAAPSRST